MHLVTLGVKEKPWSPVFSIRLPLRAISVISAPGHPFHSPAADEALFTSLRQHLRPEIPVLTPDVEINDPAFARACAETLLAHLAGAHTSDAR